jgi:hypothetical protein
VKRTFPGILLASVLISLVYASCSKVDFTEIGSGLIPVVDNINTFETVLDVETDNLLFDDTTKMFEEQHAIGIIENDPEFGKTEASLYFTTEPLSYPAYPFLNKDSVEIDSLVLSLAYTQSYGDSNSIQTFEVREIDQAAVFRKDSSYRLTAANFPVIPTVLGSKQVNFSTLNDSVFYNNYKDSVRTKNELRIHLDTSFARRFVSYDSSLQYKNDSIFKRNFKGFEVRVNEGASPVKNALAYFDLNKNTQTRLTFYCRVTRNGKQDTINPVFIYSDDPNANIVKRTPAGNYLANVNNATANDEKIYLQSTPGSYAKIRIPGLDTMTNRVVHLAELVVETIPSEGNDVFAPQNILYLDALSDDEDSAYSIRHDFIQTTSAPFYDISTLGGTLRNGKYNFNLSRYVQGILTRKEKNWKLRLYSPYIANVNYLAPNGQVIAYRSIYINTPVARGRVVLGGGAHPTNRMRLRIIYSKI